MSVTLFAAQRDVEDRWRPLETSEVALALSLIGDASIKALALVPSLKDDIANGKTSPDLVRAIVSAAVVRVLRNPDGWRQEAIDDYSRTRDGALSGGMLGFTDDELGLLRGSTASPRVRVGWLG